jgi:hypothetical protein
MTILSVGFWAPGFQSPVMASKVLQNEYRFWVGKPKGKRPIEEPIHTWEDNTETGLKKIGNMVWTGFI